MHQFQLDFVKQASYADVLLPELIECYGEELEESCNFVIRLYDFEYEEAVEEAWFGTNRIVYLGSVLYED